MSNKNFGFGTQIRKSPYFDSTVKWGAKAFSVYNHMYIPRDFGDPEKNFWNLINDAILCDVSVERQVEITGPDAAKFIQLLTPRDLSKLSVNQCKYVLIVNQNGGILNDQPSNFLKGMTKNIPKGRMMKISDLYGIIELLCSDKSQYINGSPIILDGGYSSW